MDRGAWHGYSPWSCKKESGTTERLTVYSQTPLQINNKAVGFPGGSVVKSQNRRHRSAPRSGRIPHALKQLSL